ncbi:TPA: hypothetical protein I7730_01300 [Vibrio vulnificus]|uniref:Uncharacterized protein n=1 Tax=Vibrio vulnificus TaxID=672 RepID=A0A8H9K5X5_VIBVL|nr:hypothetical protein [Vibrio vulnificus]HAS8538433.1 hypothetical protein [Vibrio vulnificus]
MNKVITSIDSIAILEKLKFGLNAKSIDNNKIRFARLVYLFLNLVELKRNASSFPQTLTGKCIFNGLGDIASASDILNVLTFVSSNSGVIKIRQTSGILVCEIT